MQNAQPTYEHLGLLAEYVEGLESMRKKWENRLRALTADPTEKIGEKGGTFGKGLPEWHPDVLAVQIQVEQIAEIEKQAIKNLERAMKDHPFGLWMEKQKGVGAKGLGRLLGTIGDPADRQFVSQLWAYCGYHVVDGQAPRRKKGQKANWSTEAKTRAYLIVEANKRCRDSVYREVYDRGREKYEGKVHTHPCFPCGGKSNPAAPGTPWKPGHQQAAALRLASKTLLKDLWIEAKRLREAELV